MGDILDKVFGGEPSAADPKELTPFNPGCLAIRLAQQGSTGALMADLLGQGISLEAAAQMTRKALAAYEEVRR